jgi:polar amino acid transport system substrate-binding protein
MKLKSPLTAVTPEALAGHTIGVEANTAHHAYLKAFYSGAVIKPYPTQESLRASLREGQTEAIFGDGIALSLWLNGTDSAGCCAFQGGPFTESFFFGNGVSLAVAKGETALRALLDYELEKVSRDGTYTDLYLKYFPAGIY